MNAATPINTKKRTGLNCLVIKLAVTLNEPKHLRSNRATTGAKWMFSCAQPPCIISGLRCMSANPSSDRVFFRRRYNDLMFPWRAVAHYWGEGGNKSRQQARVSKVRTDPI